MPTKQSDPKNPTNKVTEKTGNQLNHNTARNRKANTRGKAIDRMHGGDDMMYDVLIHQCISLIGGDESLNSIKSDKINKIQTACDKKVDYMVTQMTSSIPGGAPKNIHSLINHYTKIMYVQNPNP